MGLLSVLILLPLVGILPVWLLPDRKNAALGASLAVSIIQLLAFALGAVPYLEDVFSTAENSVAFTEKLQWISLPWSEGFKLRFDYHLRLDGLNTPLVLLALIVQPIAIIASKGIERARKAYFTLFLVLNAAILGCFLAYDLFLFYLFFEFMLLPMYFLIAYWGGGNREAAALKFFLYTLAGSLLLLLVLLALLFSYPIVEGGETAYHLDLSHLVGKVAGNASGLLADPDWRTAALVLVVLAFAIKLPAAPLHTWLPQAHVEAPAPISVILAALLLKIGGYGLFRIGGGIFHDQVAALSVPIAWLAVFTILYGGLNALTQNHFKRMIAYSSVSHMGFVLLGFAAATPEALNGAQLLMFNHGVNSAALFIIAGMLHDRVHDYRIDHFGGLLKRMPVFGFVTAFAFFAALGLPGLNAFVSEFLVLAGAFRASQGAGFISIYGVLAAATGIFLSAAYFLLAYRRMFLGELFLNGGEDWKDKLLDLSNREFLLLAPLLALMLLLGLYPTCLIDLSDGALSELSRWMRP